MDSIRANLPLYLGAAGVFVVIGIIYKIFTDPLRHVPGPWYARFTSLGYMTAVLRAKDVQWKMAQHARYGPAVRVTPTEVSFSSYQAFREIHKIGAGFTKSAFYNTQDASFGEHPSIFSMRDVRAHASRRKLYARVMSASQLRKDWEGVVRERVEFAIERIKQDFETAKVQKGEAATVDVSKWWRLLASDVSTHLSFGESFRNLELGEKVKYMKAIDGLPVVSVVQSLLPKWFIELLGRAPFPEWISVILNSASILSNQGELAFANSKANAGSKNIFAHALIGLEKDESGLTEIDISNDASTFIAAGTDTTANTLLCITMAVLQRPSLQRDLEDEVGSVTHVSDEVLESLPILNSVIDETLRLYGPAAGSLPRLPPRGGATIEGVLIPEGFVVSSPPYAFHRDPDMFSNPHEFDNTRFLADKNPRYEEAKRLLTPFGAGSRTCVGMHIAIMEIRLAIAQFFRECKGARMASSMEGQELEVKSLTFITPPTVSTLEAVL